MTSNSRPVTQTISFRTPPPVPANRRLTETYSDGLMDDLFNDVDRILEGDLSTCMTFVNKQKPARHQPATGTRTVQLPSNFVPTSAADIYRATMAASGAQYSAPVSAPTHSAPSYSAPRQSAAYRNGGRPVTSFHASAAQSGNFRSAVIQTPGAGTTTVDVQPMSSQSSATLYPQAPSQFPLSDLSPRPPQTIFEPKASQQGVSLPFLLMGAAGISVASTLGLWALGNSGPGGGALLSFNTEASAAELPNSEEDFLAYLQKSLATISANQLQASQLSAVIPVAAPAGAVPTTVPNVNAAPAVGALPNLPGAPTAAPSVIERVFVPVYENNKPTQTAVAPSAAPVPSVAVPAPAARPTVPVPAPVAAAAAIPPGAPAEAAASVPIVSVGNALPTPAVTTAAAPTNSAITGLTDTTPYSEQVLVGVLNLGSRSAALFDVDGTSQRAYVGDRIGTSEWSLVSVNGQDVVIRRDGEVRSVYIGQRF
ncbi:MAG: hypothetical protein AAFY54_07190 [Cyanobacteria bacterium J06648_10]